jgi:branched-chain amino acid transport system substrate-binding protein
VADVPSWSSAWSRTGVILPGRVPDHQGPGRLVTGELSPATSDSPEGASMTPDGVPVHPVREHGLTRRSVLRGLGTGALATGAGGVLTACGSGSKGSGSAASSGTITLGYIGPFTGPLSGFAAGDRFVIDTVRATSAYANGFDVGGRTYRVDIVVMDSQSDPNQAAQAARQLILSNNVDMLVTTSTPETVNPVAVVAQTQGVPCLATNDPWESWYMGLGGNPAQPATTFQFCTLFFYGLKQFEGCFVPMWSRIRASNRSVACMYPNDADGNAFRAGFEPLIRQSGYHPVDGGAYTDGTTDYTAMITMFKAKDCQYYSNCPLPADFSTFWKQASQQGFRPKLATVAKVLLFPADTVALGPLASNIATDSWWGPYMPSKSSLTGETASTLANAYQAQTGRQWIQSIGSSYALFEVVREVFAHSGVSDPHDKQEVAAAMHQVNYTGMCGHLDFTSGPAPGVAIINPVGVQWKKATGKYPFELKVVDNSLDKAVPVEAPLEPTNP